jgi:hypothetical protein
VELIDTIGRDGAAKCCERPASSSSSSAATSDAAALTHRLVTAWVTPVFGWFAFRNLERGGEI